jgi:CheY-like chemotaxis protein
MTTLLIIDDLVEMRRVFKLLLRSRGYEFIEANNGIDGQLLALQQKPEAIFLDAFMPGQDGFETCRNLRGIGYDGTIVIMGVLGTANEWAQVYRSGATGYLPKPITKLILQTCLEQLGIHAQAITS